MPPPGSATPLPTPSILLRGLRCSAHLFSPCSGLSTPFRHNGRTHSPARPISIGWHTWSPSSFRTDSPPLPQRYPCSADDPGWRHHYAASGGSSSSPGDHTYGGSSATPRMARHRPLRATPRTPLRRPSPLADLLDRRRARPDARPPALPSSGRRGPGAPVPDTCGRGPSSVPPSPPQLEQRSPAPRPPPLWGWHGPRLSTICPAGPRACPL